MPKILAMKEIWSWPVNGKRCFDSSRLSDKGKREFIRGWVEAGGRGDDPRSMPWLNSADADIELPAYCVNYSDYQLGQIYWKVCKSAGNVPKVARPPKLFAGLAIKKAKR